MSYQPPPGMPGWTPGHAPLPPGAGVCTACGYVGPLNYAAALGAPGTHRWCPRCGANLGLAPVPPSSNSTGCGMLLALFVGGAVVLGIASALAR